ncbi:globin isoform X1 [Euwallacea similis]|uniref:globin isoform X1 n=2 Tax=Euwallacea similis TaxID=1736056 RepID=UPI00344B9AA1
MFSLFRKVMGTVVSYILPGNTGRTDDPDKLTGLTSRDKYLVKSSWAKIMKAPADNGVALLCLFFEKYPDYVQLFPFKDVPVSEFNTNVRFRAHANSVVYALSSIVDALNDNNLLVQILTKTGTSHVPRGVTAEAFLHLKEVTIELFSTLFKPEEVEAWKKTLDVAFFVIIKGVDGVK